MLISGSDILMGTAPSLIQSLNAIIMMATPFFLLGKFTECIFEDREINPKFRKILRKIERWRTNISDADNNSSSSLSLVLQTPKETMLTKLKDLNQEKTVTPATVIKSSAQPLLPQLLPSQDLDVDIGLQIDLEIYLHDKQKALAKSFILLCRDLFPINKKDGLIAAKFMLRQFNNEELRELGEYLAVKTKWWAFTQIACLTLSPALPFVLFKLVVLGFGLNTLLGLLIGLGSMIGLVLSPLIIIGLFIEFFILQGCRSSIPSIRAMHSYLDSMVDDYIDSFSSFKYRGCRRILKRYYGDNYFPVDYIKHLL